MMGTSTLKMAPFNRASVRLSVSSARMESSQSMANNPPLLASVDLVSNSFRLIVGRVEETDAGSQIYQGDAVREPVRLAAGLSRGKMLDRASQGGGWGGVG